MSEFKWNLGTFLDFIFFFPVLMTISMNLFDQLVIVICDPDLRGSAPSRKNMSLGLLFVVSYCYFGYENWSDLIHSTPTLSCSKYQCLLPKK